MLTANARNTRTLRWGGWFALFGGAVCAALMLLDDLSQFSGDPLRAVLTGLGEGGTVLLLGGAVAVLCHSLSALLLARQQADEQAQKILESEAWTRAIVDTAGEGIITMNDRGIITSFNSAAAAIFGYSPNEVIGRSASVLMPSPHSENHDDYVARYVRTGEARVIGMRREVLGMRKDGSVFPLEIICSDVRLPGRQMFTGVVQDISARVRAEELARQRQMELTHVARLTTMGEMATGLAHEINQPLAAIVNYIQACLQRIHGGEPRPVVLLPDLERASDQAERAGEIIERIRNFIREREPRRTAVDLNGLAREAADLMRSEARQTGARVLLELEDSLPRVTADPVQIEQVLVNLMRNGLEAMAGNGNGLRQLTIQTHRTNDESVECAICDTGPGLPDGDTDRIFESFFTTKQHGLGMGLPISRTIVEAFGGHLSAASGPERGAVLRFTLPIHTGDTGP
ncbi:MAG TPA: PAS domain S-box protein [Phycisphaerae bacterium]|nr:PAS domain S-box protein [Phycisphaerae bacterium]